jgi:hypothetical protein
MLYGPQGAFGPAGPTASQRAAQERHKAVQARMADAARRNAGQAKAPAVSSAELYRPAQCLCAEHFFDAAWKILSAPTGLSVEEPKHVPSVQRIQQAVCEHYQITTADLLSASRAQEFATPRQVAMYLCRTLTGRSMPDIGRRFGDRKHTTVLHAARKIAARLERSPRLARQIEAIVAQLRTSATP